MGIRFRCHHCQHTLHVKDFQAGRRSRCPSCEMPFRIPPQDQEHSLPVETSLASSQNSPAYSEMQTADSLVERSGDFEERISQETKTESNAVQLASPPQASITIASTKKSTEEKSPAAPPPANSISSSLPDAIRTSPEALWYVRPPSGGQFGPAAGHVFLQWIQERRVTRDSLVWREGWEQWRLAEDVFIESFPFISKAGPPEPVFTLNVEKKSNENPGESITPSVNPPAWLLRKKQRKQTQQRQITVGLAVLAVFLTLVLIWVLFFRSKEKEKSTTAKYQRNSNLVECTPTTNLVFVVHSKMWCDSDSVVC